jgi:hypothetical protein
MQDKTNTEHATTQGQKPVYNPQPSTGTPEWVRKLKESRDGESWDVRIIRQAIDLFSYNDGVFWAHGYEGVHLERDEDGDVISEVNTHAGFSPFYAPMPEAWVDAMPNGEYQLVTDKVCAIGSIQLLIGGGDDNADYQTIIERLNDIAREYHRDRDGIVAINDGYGREKVLEVMNEYVNRYGGREGYVLPDFKPLVRLDSKVVEPIESDED